MKSGIYEIIAPSGGRYIGSAVDLNARWRQHRYEMRHGIHFNKGLQRAFDKYGELKFSTLLVCSINKLIFFEQRAIDILKPRYNARPVAESQLGLRHSEETKAKISRNRTGKGQHPPERRAANAARMIGNSLMVGIVMSPEWRANISRGNKGKLHSDGFEARLTSRTRTKISTAYENGRGLVSLAKEHRVDHRVMKRILLSAGIRLR